MRIKGAAAAGVTFLLAMTIGCAAPPANDTTEDPLPNGDEDPKPNDGVTPPKDEPKAPSPADGACVVQGAKSVCTYKTVDGLSLKADVHRAAGDEVRPALLWLHGGALIAGERDWLEPAQLERYRKAGYVVVSIDYRLAPETKLDQIHEDVASAYAWMREKGPALFKIDPDRIGLVGHSAGGYLTLTSGVRLMPRPKALVSFYGYGDVTGSWYTTPNALFLQDEKISREDAMKSVGTTPLAGSDDDERFVFYAYCRQTGTWPLEVGGHDPKTEAAFFAPFEAIKSMGADYPPTILLHGNKDTDVPFEQATAMDAALTSKNIPHELVQDATWEHGFDEDLSDPKVSAAFDKVIAFLETHLKN